MTTPDPSRIRTTISVDREVHQIFVRMAEAGGMSVSRCMGEWLSDTSEGAMFVAQKMVDARKAPKMVMREMQAMASGLQEEVSNTMKMMQEMARKEARSALPEPSPTSSAPSQAPSSLTGLKSPRAKAKK